MFFVLGTALVSKCVVPYEFDYCFPFLGVFMTAIKIFLFLLWTGGTRSSWKSGTPSTRITSHFKTTKCTTAWTWNSTTNKPQFLNHKSENPLPSITSKRTFTIITQNSFNQRYFFTNRGKIDAKTFLKWQIQLQSSNTLPATSPAVVATARGRTRASRRGCGRICWLSEIIRT